MLYPSIYSLLKKVDSRYTLVILSAKRARQIVDGRNVLIKSDSNAPVTLAINEINQDKVTYTKNS